MTNDNYTILSNRELLDIFRQSSYSNTKLTLVGKGIVSDLLVEEIIRRTKFLDTYFNEINKPVPFQTRVFCLGNNIETHPICQNPECTNKVGWNYREHRFLHHCCRKCSATDYLVKDKLKNTVKQIYGVEYVFQSKEVQRKIRETCQSKWGVDNPSQAQEIIDKISRINLQRHGVKWIFQSEEFRRKSKDTCNLIYGVDHPTQSPEIQKRIVETTRKRFGVDRPAQSKEVLDKIRMTNLERRGVEWALQSKETQEKSKQTNLEKRGVENPMQSQEVKDKAVRTCEEKYGVQYVTQTDWFKKQSEESCMERYGVRNYSQSKEFAKKAHLPYTNPKYPNIKFTTSWEFKVYDFLIENHIEFEYQPEISIPYKYDGTTWTYHPDFKVGNRIVEVKGDQFFRFNEETGKEEMFLTWRDPKLSDEEYEWKCAKEEAKHQCMIANNVIILRKKDIDHLAVESFIKKDQTY